MADRRISCAAMAILLVAGFGIAGCEQGLGRGAPSKDNPFAPAGVDTTEQAVDGLVVGHTLMAAGEYDLALKAYHRAAATHGITVDVLSAIGSANLKLARLNQAEDQLRQAVKIDQTFVPAWNNLGVVLMERGEYGEARRVFELAFALDSGRSAQIRENLKRAIAKMENTAYSDANNNFDLVRRGNGRYLLLQTPESGQAVN